MDSTSFAFANHINYNESSNLHIFRCKHNKKIKKLDISITITQLAQIKTMKADVRAILKKID